MTEAPWLSEWDEVIAGSKPEVIEEFWLARLEAGIGDGEDLVDALRRLRSGGKKALSATLLELAAEQASSDGLWPARQRFLVELIRLGVGDAGAWVAGLDECVRRRWAHSPSLASLLRHFSLTSARKPLDTLEIIENWLFHDVGGVFGMAGRGAGRVIEANPQVGVLRLDFENEKRVPVPIDAARRFLQPLPAGHFLRRRLEDREQLAAELSNDPQASLADLLTSFGRPMTLPEIRSAVEGVLPAGQFNPWWSKARRNPQVLASGSGTKVAYRLASETGADDEIRAEARGADLAGLVELARRYGGRSRELAELFAALLLERSASSTDAAIAWDAVSAAARLGAASDAVLVARERVLAICPPLDLLARLTDAASREGVFEHLWRERPDGASEVSQKWLFRETHPRLLMLQAAELLRRGQEPFLRKFVDQVFLHPQRAAAAFVWLLEEPDERMRPLVEERLTGAQLVRLVELSERKEFTGLRPRLREVLSPQGLGGRLVQDRVSVEQARRIVQILETPGELGAERAWLRRALTARFPDLREKTPVESVPALAETVLRMQAELRRLVEREIPETLKAIAAAKEHGDLRENFEYHAARARQEFLSSRAAQLQEDLGRVRVIDPSTVDASRVRVGTRVRLLRGDAAREIAILGQYEADPERGIISLGSDAGQALVDHVVGDEVVVAGERWRVAAIEPFTP